MSIRTKIKIILGFLLFIAVTLGSIELFLEANPAYVSRLWWYDYFKFFLIASPLILVLYGLWIIVRPELSKNSTLIYALLPLLLLLFLIFLIIPLHSIFGVDIFYDEILSVLDLFMD